MTHHRDQVHVAAAQPAVQQRATDGTESAAEDCTSTSAFVHAAQARSCSWKARDAQDEDLQGSERVSSFSTGRGLGRLGGYSLRSGGHTRRQGRTVRCTYGAPCARTYRASCSQEAAVSNLDRSRCSETATEHSPVVHELVDGVVPEVLQEEEKGELCGW